MPAMREDTSLAFWRLGIIFGVIIIAEAEAAPAIADALAAHLKAQIGVWGPVIKKAGAFAD